MNSNELYKIRKLVNKEIMRRKRIKELLENDLIKEYLKLTNTEAMELDSNNIQEILNEIMASFSIVKTNGIYVCTRAYYVDWQVNYEETDYYSKDVEINSKNAKYRIYKDIESGKCIEATKHLEMYDCRPIIENFEKDKIILNPYNTYKNQNGYDEVKSLFLETALKDGQAKAKKLILKKYPQLEILHNSYFQ